MVDNDDDRGERCVTTPGVCSVRGWKAYTFPFPSPKNDTVVKRERKTEISHADKDYNKRIDDCIVLSSNNMKLRQRFFRFLDIIIYILHIGI